MTVPGREEDLTPNPCRPPRCPIHGGGTCQRDVDGLIMASESAWTPITKLPPDGASVLIAWTDGKRWTRAKHLGKGQFRRTSDGDQYYPGKVPYPSWLLLVPDPPKGKPA